MFRCQSWRGGVLRVRTYTIGAWIILCSGLNLAVAQPEAELSPARMITTGRIGPALVGGTLEQFQREMSGYVLQFLPNFGDGYSALCAFDEAEALICAAIPRRANALPSEKVTFLRTTNPRYRTVEGIGPGSLLADAVSAYGPVTLTYDPKYAEREYATFGEAPENMKFFPARRIGTGPVGLYPSRGRYTPVTTQYTDDAIVRSVEVWATP